MDNQVPKDRVEGESINLTFQVGSDTFELASQITYGDDLTAFLTKDASLWIMDQEGRSILGTLKFDGPLLDFNDGSKVIISKDILIVYFRDSKQLYAFRVLPRGDFESGS